MPMIYNLQYPTKHDACAEFKKSFFRLRQNLGETFCQYANPQGALYRPLRPINPLKSTLSFLSVLCAWNHCFDILSNPFLFI